MGLISLAGDHNSAVACPLVVINDGSDPMPMLRPSVVRASFGVRRGGSAEPRLGKGIVK
jgi:hypothetical protein